VEQEALVEALGYLEALQAMLPPLPMSMAQSMHLFGLLVEEGKVILVRVVNF
jgi:hypothetical protein